MDPEALLKQLGIDLKKDAEDLEVVEGVHDFKMFTRDGAGNGLALKAFVEKDEETGEEAMFIAGIASSTIKDRHGDVMLPSALIDMERQANDNLTIFLNHSYRVPQDVAGSVVKASIQSRATDPESGAPIYDLDFEKIRINRENEDAVKTFKALQPKGKNPGVRLGLSIGARIPEGGAIRNKKTGQLLIAHVDLLETSIVSIPANPRSWIQNAVKALKSAPSEEVHGNVVLETAEIKGLNPDEIADAVAERLGEKLSKSGPTTVGEAGPEAVVLPIHTEPTTTASATPQEAPTSGPEAGEAAPDVSKAAAPEAPAPVDLSKATTPELLNALVEAQGALAGLSSKYIDVVNELATEKQRADKAERERDQVAATAKAFTEDMAQLIDRLSKLPVGQKASFKNIQREFDEGLDVGLSGIYTEGFLKTLRGEQTT